jgi:hypothetical protein
VKEKVVVQLSFGKFMVIPVAIAIQAFILMVITPYIPLNGSEASGFKLLTWVSFQAWAMYFLAGCNPKMGVKTLIGYIGGIIASIAIFELAGVFAGLNAGTNAWGLYLAVLIVVVPVIAMEKVPWCDFIPAYFIGAGVFFGLYEYLQQPEGAAMGKCTWYSTVATAEIVACVVGLIFGAITVYGRVWYEGKVGVKVEEEAAG